LGTTGYDDTFNFDKTTTVATANCIDVQDVIKMIQYVLMGSPVPPPLTLDDLDFNCSGITDSADITIYQSWMLDNITYLPECFLFLDANGSAASSITPSSNLDVIFPTEIQDTKNRYNPSTGIFTAASEGLYHVTSIVSVANPDGSLVVLNLLKNGVYEAGGPIWQARQTTQTIAYISTPVYAMPGDTFQIQVRYEGNSTRTIYGARLRIYKVPASPAALSYVRASGSAAASINPGVNINVVCPTEINDSMGEYNPATGVFQPATAGYYHITSTATVARPNGSLVNMGLVKNGVGELMGPLYEARRVTQTRAFVSGPVYLDTTDSLQVTLRYEGNTACTIYGADFKAYKIPEPAAGSLVYLKAKGSLAGSVSPHNSVTPYTALVFKTEMEDTAAAYDPGTGIFTAPEDGYFSVSALCAVGSPDGSLVTLFILKNGNVETSGMIYQARQITQTIAHVSWPVELTAGDTVQIGIRYEGNTTRPIYNADLRIYKIDN
jgi:hypothetical protein